MKEYLFIDGIKAENVLALRSLFYGEGLFETFRYKGRLPVLLEKHLERMENGASLLKIPFPGREYMIGLIRKAISESDISDAYIKICLLSQGQSRFYETANISQPLVIVKEYVGPEQFVKLKVSSFRRISDSHLVKIKSTNYLENILARREALASGFDEALFLNEKGEVAECSTSNIFWFRDGTLFAPSEESGLLNGTTKVLVLEFMTDYDVNLTEGEFVLDDLIRADFVFVTNSLIGCIPVSAIDDHSFNVGHPLFLKIQNTLFEKLKWA
ncbi:MAG: aminodeoxychorismate lyase [Thermodesulfobacteriota bacterium]|nr:MAG: aminodeoxychorismate lyase [Thermodesulfobacteriota bacterium]